MVSHGFFPCGSKEAKWRCFFRFCFGDALDRRRGVWAHDTLVLQVRRGISICLGVEIKCEVLKS